MGGKCGQGHQHSRVIPSVARDRTACRFRSDAETSPWAILRFAQDDSVIRLPCFTAVPPYRPSSTPEQEVGTISHWWNRSLLAQWVSHQSLPHQPEEEK